MMRPSRNLCSALQIKIPRRPAFNNISQIDPPATVLVVPPTPSLNSIRRQRINVDFRGKMILWNGSKKTIDPEKNPLCKECVKFVLEDHNQKMCGKQQLELVKIIHAEYKLVAGFLYFIIIKAKDKVDGHLKIFNARVHDLNGYTIKSFEMVEDLGPSKKKSFYATPRGVRSLNEGL